MTAIFDQVGLCFQYPENWKISDEQLMEWPRTVSIQSPSSGFWTVVQYELGTESLALLEETLKQMRAEYPDLESSVIFEHFDETEVLGYEMFFYCLDFLVCARAMAIRTDNGQVLLILWQAEDRDFAGAEPVFRAMTTSLLRNQVSE